MNLGSLLGAPDQRRLRFRVPCVNYVSENDAVDSDRRGKKPVANSSRLAHAGPEVTAQVTATRSGRLNRRDSARRRRSECLERRAGVPVEEPVDAEREAALAVDGPPDGHRQGRDGPEVATDPEDGRPDLLIGVGREPDPGHMGVDRVPAGRVNNESDMARTNMTTLVEMIAPICQSG